MDVMDFIQQHEGQNLANPRDRAQAVENLGIVRLGGVDKRELKLRKEAVVGVEQRQVDLDALLDGGIGEAFRDPLPVGLVGELLADFGQLVLTVGILDMSQQGRALAHERHPTPQQVPGGPHLGRINVRLGEHPPTEQHRSLVGIDCVVCGLATVNGLHVERMAQAKRDPFLGTQVSQPVPREESIRPRRRHPRDRVQ
jgi:hypothetical protein